jgi:SAM-dependent methyltransferase
MKQTNSALGAVYNREFQHGIEEPSLRSARRVWPALLSAIAAPASVADFGCGAGSWLAALREILPRCDIVGVDHPSVPDYGLRIAAQQFVGADLTRPVDLGRRFDLCLSVEVAEHLPPQHAAGFVATLVRHADLIAFSAAIPGQGGTAHLNEQWPSYWIALFSQHGYRCHDVIRPRLWNDSQIECSYRQNLLLFAAAGATARLQIDSPDWSGADLVHPQMLESMHRRRTARTFRNLYRFLTRRL